MRKFLGVDGVPRRVIGGVTLDQFELEFPDYSVLRMTVTVEPPSGVYEGEPMAFEVYRSLVADIFGDESE